MNEQDEVLEEGVTRTPPGACPTCGHLIDAASSAREGDTAAPKPNDISICLECATVMLFNDDLSLRLMTEEECRHLPIENKIELAVAVVNVRKFIAERRVKH